MTSSLASNSDKFKITITLRRARKFGDTGPHKYSHFLFNPLKPEFLFIIQTAFSWNSVIRYHTKCEISPKCHLDRAEDASFVSGVVVFCRCDRESRPQEGGGIAQAWKTWSEGDSAPNGTVKCRGHGVPEIVTPASRTTAVLLGF